MRKLFLALMLGALLVFPSVAFAQTNITLPSVNVQLWPEYDQPSMLVITDFEMPAGTQFPIDLSFRIPADANLIAVAQYTADGALIEAKSDGPKTDGEWQVFTMTVEYSTARFEYYQPLTFNGEQRLFSYLWDSDYAVDAFTVSVLEPRDTTSLTTNPSLKTVTENNGLKTYSGTPVKLASGKQFTMTVDYKKTTDVLVAEPQGVQAAQPVSEDTTGRVSLNNYLPYIIGGLGVIMIVGGVIYYWRSGNSDEKKPRRRSHSSESADDDEGSYCPQCGTRAKPGDRFCRTCGARLRTQEE